VQNVFGGPLVRQVPISMTLIQNRWSFDGPKHFQANRGKEKEGPGLKEQAGLAMDGGATSEAQTPKARVLPRGGTLEDA